MVPVMPHVDVPGDNLHGYDRESGELYRAADDNDCSIRPRIMARSGQFRGMDLTHAVWCFGFLRHSEMHALGVCLPDDTLFFWVLATHDGTVVETVTNAPAIDLPDNFRSVITWDPRATIARSELWSMGAVDDVARTKAVVYDDDGEIHDRCYAWETGQNFAQSGMRVVAVADDGHMDIEQAQRLYDYERDCHIDCFGGGDDD